MKSSLVRTRDVIRQMTEVFLWVHQPLACYYEQIAALATSNLRLQNSVETTARQVSPRKIAINDTLQI